MRRCCNLISKISCGAIIFVALYVSSRYLLRLHHRLVGTTRYRQLRSIPELGEYERLLKSFCPNGIPDKSQLIFNAESVFCEDLEMRTGTKATDVPSLQELVTIRPGQCESVKPNWRDNTLGGLTRTTDEALIQQKFRPYITLKDRLILLNLMRDFDTLALEAGAKYVISSGTLLAFVRCKSRIIPWDDDIDVQMLIEDEKRFIDYVREKNIVNRYIQTGYNPKFMSTEHEWPYIDILTYGESSVRPDIICGTVGIRPINRTDVFPTKRASFEGVRVSLPNNIIAVLEGQIGFDVMPGNGDKNYMKECDSPDTNHLEVVNNEYRIRTNCSLVDKWFPCGVDVSTVVTVEANLRHDLFYEEENLWLFIQIITAVNVVVVMLATLVGRRFRYNRFRGF